jgi:hypothetical protein
MHLALAATENGVGGKKTEFNCQDHDYFCHELIPASLLQ